MATVRNGGTYALLNVGTRTAVDLSGANRDNGTAIIGWEFHTFDPGYIGNQTWKVEYVGNPDGNGYQWCKLTCVATGSVMDLKGGVTDNGTPIIGWQYHGGDNQLWLLSPCPQLGKNGPKYYQIYNKMASAPQRWRCVDLNNGNPANNTPITIWDATDIGKNPHQGFILVEIS